jgi:anti-sigma regulatory factor (Ser/Thr protein kinase)
MTPAAGYDDDVAVLIYRHPPAPLVVQVSADDRSSLGYLRRRLREWLPAAGLGTAVATDVLIAAGEAAANAVEHATEGRPDGAPPVWVTLTAEVSPAAEVNGAAIRLTVTDTGTWQPPPADRREPAPETRGHGIIFMHALMDDVTIEPSPDGTTVTLTKDLTP